MRVEVEIKEKRGRGESVPYIDLRDGLQKRFGWVNDIGPKNPEARRLVVCGNGPGGFNVTEAYQAIISGGYSIVESRITQ